jgi:hypothetical protein
MQFRFHRVFSRSSVVQLCNDGRLAVHSAASAGGSYQVSGGLAADMHPPLASATPFTPSIRITSLTYTVFFGYIDRIRFAENVRASL